MTKKCEINLKEICNNCGECDICDLNSKKTCDSCGKCLESNEKFDSRGIEIEEILEDQSEELDFTSGEEGTSVEVSKDPEKDDLEYEFVEDLENLSGIIEDLKEKNASAKAFEAYPGLIILGNKKDKNLNEEEMETTEDI